MGGSSSKNSQDVTMNAVANMITTVQNEARAGNSAVNLINVSGDTDGDVNISDVTMSAKQTISLTSLLNAIDTQTGQQALSQSLTQSATAAVKGCALGSSADAANNVKSYVGSTMNQMSSMSQNCDAVNSASNVISVSGHTRGNLNISNIDMSTVQDTIMKCMMSSSTSKSAIQDLSQSISQTATATVTGLDLTTVIVAIVIVVGVLLYAPMKMAGVAFSFIVNILKVLFVIGVVGGLIVVPLYNYTAVDPKNTFFPSDKIDPSVVIDSYVGSDANNLITIANSSAYPTSNATLVQNGEKEYQTWLEGQSDTSNSPGNAARYCKEKAYKAFEWIGYTVTSQGEAVDLPSGPKTNFYDSLSDEWLDHTKNGSLELVKTEHEGSGNSLSLTKSPTFSSSKTGTPAVGDMCVDGTGPNAKLYICTEAGSWPSKESHTFSNTSSLVVGSPGDITTPPDTSGSFYLSISNPMSIRLFKKSGSEWNEEESAEGSGFQQNSPTYFNTTGVAIDNSPRMFGLVKYKYALNAISIILLLVSVILTIMFLKGRGKKELPVGKGYKNLFKKRSSEIMVAIVISIVIIRKNA